jgi:glycosyltransferase involved in cell wall biosynthesis
LFVCDPLWGVVLLTEAWRTIDCPLLLSLRVLNTPDLLRRAAQAPFWLYTAVSDSLRRDVRQHEDLKPFEVLPNSVDSQRNQPAELPEGGTIVFCNARISPEKGVLDLVQSFPAVMRTVAKAELWLCGGDSPFGAPSAYRQRVLQAIDDLGIGHCVRILPKLRWDEIPATIHAARVVVLPSHAETFGRAALEAMACGRPLVVTNVGNLPWLVQDAGKVVDAGDPVQLAAAITASLLDDEQARRMRLLGIARAADFTNERVAARLLELLQSRARGDA